MRELKEEGIEKGIERLLWLFHFIMNTVLVKIMEKYGFESVYEATWETEFVYLIYRFDCFWECTALLSTLDSFVNHVQGCGSFWVHTYH